MGVVNPRKHVSVKMLSGFHKSGLEEFFRNISYGKTGTAVSTFDDLQKSPKWKNGTAKMESSMLPRMMTTWTTSTGETMMKSTTSGETKSRRTSYNPVPISNMFPSHVGITTSAISSRDRRIE